MRFQQIKDVLAWTEAFHRALGREYEQLAGHSAQPRVAMLLDYLAAHENALADAMHQYEGDAADGLLKTWYQSAPDVALPDDLDSLCQALDCASTAGVVAMSIDFHDLLIGLYEQLTSQAPTPEAEALFANLSSLETREKMRMVRDAQELEDL